MRARVVVLSLAVFCVSGGGATLERLSLSEMIEQSTSVIRGRVAGSFAAFHGPVIYTHFKVQVLERWKGEASGEVEVAIPGGLALGLRQSFAGAPGLAEGAEYVLFLWTGKGGITQVIGLSQGVFDVRRDAAGEPVVTRNASTETMLDSAGRVVEDAPLQLRLPDLGARISRTLARPVKQ